MASTPTEKDDLPTIWEAPDALWDYFFLPLLTEFDPMPRMGRPRADQRKCLNGVIYRARTGCQWNQLPQKFGNDATVHRTLKRWDDKGIFDKLWALLIYHCDDLGEVHWEWQAADGCLNKARFIGKKGAKAERVSQPHQSRRNRTKQVKVSVQTLATEAKWVSSKVSLSREMADRYLSASRELM